MVSDIIINGEIFFFLLILQFHPGYCNRGEERKWLKSPWCITQADRAVLTVTKQLLGLWELSSHSVFSPRRQGWWCSKDPLLYISWCHLLRIQMGFQSTWMIMLYWEFIGDEQQKWFRQKDFVSSGNWCCQWTETNLPSGWGSWKYSDCPGSTVMIW